MSKRSAAQRDAESRAEARRRARMLAQGRPPDDEEEDGDAAAAPQRGPTPSLLQRIFPPAAPLPGKADPMIGFTYTGRMRLLVSSLWLIGRNPLAGIGMGVLWALAYVLTVQYSPGIIGTISSFVSFGALVAAGWIGWQRPWLYGLVAAIIGYLAYSGFVVYILLTDPAAPTGAADRSQLVLYLLTNGVLQAAIGALAGFYGGYLRRRIADPATRQAAAARRRR
ncbi:MAG: hypothetical protein WED86_05420 [Chloroflexota bacterium]